MASMSVRVAVRCRPFNTREKDMKATCCIKMQGTATIIVHPETKDPKTFNFDFSYWSHDGFREGPDGELIPTDERYATQRMVFNDLGVDVLTNCFEGYNSTLFAYGQTGAGKSFSMVGYSVNKGIIPIVCDELFKKIELATQDQTKKYEVTVSMLEIYNEAIKDLLDPTKNKEGGLKIRSNNAKGVYVEDLSEVAVRNYVEVERQMENGTANRTIGSTKMNATSSRAHTVFALNFKQITTDPETRVVSELTARMNLVDLAGSERAESTGATGDRLKEGCAINASLSALGNVISALADISSGKKKVFVPYRNSVLTRLLQDALGGNSKTIMVCALSPADINYDETLSTLRYADRAKKIKNKVVKMENPTDKIIRMLKEENARLMALLQKSGVAVPVGGDGGDGGEGGEGGPPLPAGASPEEIEGLKSKYEAEMRAKLEEQMIENERIMGEMRKSWEEKLSDSERFHGDGPMVEGGAVSAKAAMGSNLPHILNLHEDPQMSECVVYMFKKGTSRIGRKLADTPQDIILSGLSISKEHAIVEYDGGTVTLTNLNRSKTFVNGDLVSKPVQLHTGDRVIFGNNFLFRFNNPNEPLPAGAKESTTERAWSDAMEEFSHKQGLRLSQSLGGEVSKLEEEEASKRAELEGKLKQMEDMLQKERAQAADVIERLKRGDVTAGERDDLKSLEAEYSAKARNLEEELNRRKDMSEKIIQEQMKRKRQTKKIEERLAKLMPLINEANLMAEELNKPVRFEARLAVKSTNVNLSALDELRNLKTIDIQIRVVSQENGNVWTWSHTKFESRLYMMREIYQEFMDFGHRETPKSKDPFWDPPEAFEIGKAYVYLKALSQLVEIENDFAIVDYKGDDRGTLSVKILPEGPNGEDLDYLQSAEELNGQSVVFKVLVEQAKALPDKYCNNVYITFQFGENQEETPECKTKTVNPMVNYEAKCRYDNITPDFVEYLLKDAAVFEIRGFSDSQIEERTALEAESQKGQHTIVGAGKECNHCEELEASVVCIECDNQFCESCFALLHKSAKKATHTKKPLSEAFSSTSNCHQCDEKPAIVECVECQKDLCDSCNTLLHKSAKKAEHTRKPLSGADTSKCEQCDEQSANVRCDECGGKKLCENCNTLLHKSAKKASHVRVAI